MPAVRTIQRLHGQDGKPCPEYGTACQGCPGRDPRSVNLIYEVKGHQAQPDTTRLQPTWAQPNPHRMSLPSLLKENRRCYVTSNLDLVQSQYNWFSVRRLEEQMVSVPGFWISYTGEIENSICDLEVKLKRMVLIDLWVGFLLIISSQISQHL